jgi:hypothetical protein
VANSCENGNEPSISTECWEIIKTKSKEVVVAYYKALFQHLAGTIKEKYKNLIMDRWSCANFFNKEHPKNMQ